MDAPLEVIEGVRYSYLENLDSGNYGNIHLLEDHEVKRKVILKESIPGTGRSVLNEIDIMSCLDHPNIVKSFGMLFGRIDGFSFKFKSVYMTMEYLPGTNVESMIECKNEFSEPTMKRFMIDMAEALMYLKDQKIIHVDIKPGNIICNDDQFKLIDFGLSMKLSRYSYSKDIIKNYSSSGTPYYMAPECFFENEYSFSTDIYSLGTTIHYMITRNMPFPSKGTKELKIKLMAMNYSGTDISIYDEILKSMICNKEDRIPIEVFYKVAQDFNVHHGLVNKV
jgi:serine/threonine protein kinase